MGLTLDDIPLQKGRIVVLTGGCCAIGLECARQLVGKGATVVMGCGSVQEAQPAAALMNKSGPGRALVIRLDMSQLNSIDAFVESIVTDGSLNRVDALILNAEVVTTKYEEVETRSEAYGKMEYQMAYNAVGHWYLAEKLLPLIRGALVPAHTAAPAPVRRTNGEYTHSRVITLTSIRCTQRRGINYDALYCCSSASSATTLGYNAARSYDDSKLAMLYLANELDSRYRSAGIFARAYSCHVGLCGNGVGVVGWLGAVARAVRLPFTASDAGLILSIASCLPDNQVPEGAYFVPENVFSLSGLPKPDGILPPPPPPQTQTPETGPSEEFWAACEELCGIRSKLSAFIAE